MSIRNPIAFNAVPTNQLLIAGGIGFGIYAILMFKYYPSRATVRKVFEDKDENFKKVTVMQLPQYEGNREKK
ncbi:uncharacterized protein KGF55_001943 [Candida pseudojiufengensis]|uniref:uncharacterized protein n=1 Tax=Candida pseudojiufengensis TaxID=497109 RepID=UPI0022242574|nr:uncharacterized protein KGF55_001943 [Candida pseudojiufengensis]KAI5964872.1 hypothetical protein KGF55_001943 [Candida pseudojiufengensis]